MIGNEVSRSVSFLTLAFCALALLIGQQEGHAYIKTEWRDAGMVICLGHIKVRICIWLS